MNSTVVSTSCSSCNTYNKHKMVLNIEYGAKIGIQKVILGYWVIRISFF
jgi:hypothetical protein